MIIGHLHYHPFSVGHHALVHWETFSMGAKTLLHAYLVGIV